MKTAAILLLVIAATAFAASSDMFSEMPLNFGSSRSILTLLTQVEAKLKTNGPLDAITRMLDDFKKTVTDEQLAHDNLFAKQEKECQSEFEFREKEVKDADGALRAAQETLDGCTAQQVRASSDLASTKAALIENRDFLSLIQENRKRQEYDYETVTTAFQMAIKGLEEALVILEEIWQGSASFADLTKHAHKILIKASKVNKVRALGPLMSAFVQLSLSSSEVLDEAALQRAKTLLQNILEGWKADFSAIVAEEENAKRLYEEEYARVSNIITNLETQKSELEGELAALDKCIVTQQGIVSSATAKRDRNQKLWDDAKNLCDATREEYNTSTQSRKEELKLLAAIQERVEARFAQLSSGVTQRGTQDEFNYENQSAYDHQTFTASTA